MSTVFVFVAVWVAVIFVLLVLDWLGNPNRGRFRPQRERDSIRLGTRRATRSLRRERKDAAVRAVLRDRFGRSTLRLQWNDDQESEAIRADEDLVTMSQTAAGLEQLSGEDRLGDPSVERTEDGTEDATEPVDRTGIDGDR